MKATTVVCLAALIVLGSGRGAFAAEGEKTMDKILVAYATKAGSTAGVAEAIGKTLQEEGATVDVLPAKDVKDLAGYRAVIVGSGIYMGKWLPDALRLIEKNKASLSQMPVAYFVVCATMKDDNEKTRKEVGAYSAPAQALVTPVDVGLFAGVIDYTKMNFFKRFMLKNMMKTPEGDFRNWDAIKAWTKTIYPRLKA